MKQTYLLSLAIGILFACSTKQNKRYDVISEDDTLILQESLIYEEHSATDLKKVGTEILSGASIFGAKEKYLFQLMDSIFTKDSVERAFYFSVFKKIEEGSDGYVAEAIGDYAKSFCWQYPNEFFSIPDSEIKGYAFRIGYAILASEEDPEKYAEELIIKIKSTSSNEHSQKIESFSQELSDAMNNK